MAEVSGIGRRGRSDRAHRDDLAEYVKERPLTSLAIAAAAGFILNGGATSRVCRAVAGFVGPIIIRTAASSLVVGLVSGESSAKRAEAKHQHGQYDHGRTELKDPA
jgi:hypothetical protein